VSDQPVPALVPERRPGLDPAMIETFLRDPSIDVTKLEVLLRMQQQVRADWARAEFAVAMSACQAEIQQVVRDAQNKQTSSWFARLERIDQAVRPIYTRHGFSVGYTEEIAGEGSLIVLVCKVTHKHEHTEEYRMTAPPDVLGPKGAAVKSELHGRGSSNTYMRRYLLCMAFNIVVRGMDDDGNKATAIPRINANHLAELKALIAQTNTDIPYMLSRVFKDGSVTTLEDVPMTYFAALKNSLLRKLEAPQTSAPP
jgi:hypothetical protein